ncbi:MAG: DUF1559 domain-containing protein [Pirellulales bacterium]
MPIDFTCPHCGHPTRVAEVHAGRTGPCAACGQAITLPTLDESRRQGRQVRRGSPAALLLMVGGVGFIGLLMIALLLALLAPLRGTSHAQARIRESQNNLRQIALALHNYHATYNSLPPAYVADAEGNPLHSWRVLLLPCLDRDDLYSRYDFDEPWDGPNNRLLLAEMPAVYRSPSDLEGSDGVGYAVVVGDRTLFPPGGEAVAFAQVRDGLSNTIMVVEVHDSGVAWLEPADLEFDSMAMVVNDYVDNGIASGESGAANIALADGEVRELRVNTPPDSIRAALTRDGGEFIPLP